MFHLPLSVAAWSSEKFSETLKQELERMPAAALPLQQGLASTSYALGDGFSVMVIGARSDGGVIRARIGVFYEGITAGCSCADDPTPVEPQSEYCEVELSIDKATAETSALLA